jgi:peptidyl-tRNA hydrolase
MKDAKVLIDEPIICVVGPALSDQINVVTGHLKLL